MADIRKSDFDKAAITKEIAAEQQRDPLAALPDSEKIVFLPFSIADEWFAVEIEYLQKVLKPIPITIVPQTPTYLTGVINLRGEIISVFDLWDFFGCGTISDSYKRILIFKHKKNRFGILINDSKEVTRIARQDMQPPLSTIDGYKRECIDSVFYFQDNMFSLLDINGIFQSQRMNSANW